jgi:flagellin-like protein
LKSRSSFTNRRGISPVIATIILSAVVVTIGGAVWSYAQGAASVMASDYVNSTMSIMKEITERFTVEHVNNTIDRTQLNIWIYNYRDVDIEVDVYVIISGRSYGTDIDNPLEIKAGCLLKVTVTILATSGEKAAIQVHSRRQNDAYYTYYIP